MTNKQLIKQSAEANAYMHDIKLVSIGYFLLMVSSAVSIIWDLYEYLHYMKLLLAVYLIGLSCLYLPFIGYFILKYRELFSSIEEYMIYEKYIDKANIYGSRVYFTITITDSKGHTFNVDTKRMYFTDWRSPHYEDFYQKKVTVAYNPVTEQVVLIKENRDIK